MPITIPANAYLLGIATQANEPTVPATATYSFPVFASDLDARGDVRRVDVTDANSVESDPYKGQQYGAADTIEIPAFDNVSGTIFKGMYPTDTASGTAPN